MCFATKAVHIEIVSDLTTDSFLACLKRFIARRGMPNSMYSDNGTTFVGASRQLSEMYKNFLNKKETQRTISQFLCDLKIIWQFIPLHVPYFRELWEAAVKSAKLHLYCAIGNAYLTFEELQTLLCKIKTILNSRSQTLLSDDPNDLSYITPGHFLIGDIMNSFPCHNLEDINENRLI